MKLTLKQAYQKISRERIEDLESKNYYLNAVVSVLPPGSFEPASFIFTFFNSDENKLSQITVSDENIEEKDAQQAISPTKEKLELSKVKIYPKAILKKAMLEFQKARMPFSQAILALEQNTWRVTIITKTLQAFIIEFDSEKGEIKGSRTESLMKNSQ